MSEILVDRSDNGTDDRLTALLFPFVASFGPCGLALADFIGEVIQCLVLATAISRHVKLRRIGDVEACDFLSEGGDGRH